jgi:hypothetical protein
MAKVTGPNGEQSKFDIGDCVTGKGVGVGPITGIITKQQWWNQHYGILSNVINQTNDAGWFEFWCADKDLTLTCKAKP